ncbi:MAG: helix-turn-helix transcriptional regulator, partial [Candidatus Rokubacteria bacterium]|nr:helix-turn-helix transcriptional regulator [Candidatus Rokubacteria bacterium]
MSLGARLKDLRKERGIRQKELAARSGLTPSLISQIESDKLTPSLHTLGRLAGALG